MNTRARLLVALPALACLRLQAVTISAPIVVTANRLEQVEQDVAFTIRRFDSSTLSSSPALTVDGILRGIPSFGLFRRSDSLIANPTAQGVSLRGLGPSGASRSLVLLDGVPINDPFGGWVAWAKIPREGLTGVELVPGGGATAWGAAALGGVAQVLTEGNIANFTTVATRFGSFGTRSIDFAAAKSAPRGNVQLFGSDFATDGFRLVASERQGVVDVPAWSRHRMFSLRWKQFLENNLEASVTTRGFEEFRGNGTPYQKNGSREKFASVKLAGQPTYDFAWNAVAYAQDQSFASTFSSVNATRTAETPASDQFAVPAVAIGASWVASWRDTKTNGNARYAPRTSAGVDLRDVRGETRENFTFTAGNFTRQRVAGGRQFSAGTFVLHERPFGYSWRAIVGARLDSWGDNDGHRREADRNSGALLRDDRYNDQNGSEISPSVGLVWEPADSWRFRAAGQQAFRRPTLNELYRPFRQGANVTEANPNLKTEHVTSAEIGAEWSFKQLKTSAQIPVAVVTLSATAFWNDLRDAVGNVTIARGPGTFPIVGTLAAGGLGRQRLNLDRMRVQGLELSAKWTPVSDFTLNAEILFNDATVRRATLAPALVGKRVAQVPRRNASLGATWRAPGGIVLTPRIRWIGRQFEDDENALILGECVVADLGASRALTKHLELFLTCENLGDTRLETGRSADGIVNVGTPRLFLGGIRGSW